MSGLSEEGVMEVSEPGKLSRTAKAGVLAASGGMDNLMNLVTAAVLLRVLTGV